MYNNTLYGGTPTPVSGNEFTGFRIDSAATNVNIINNLISAPTATNPVMISGTGGTGYVQSNNLLSKDALSTIFVNATPSVPADFGLKALPNPARDTGLSTVPVFSDFFRASRPQGVIDIGAVEGP